MYCYKTDFNGNGEYHAVLKKIQLLQMVYLPLLLITLQMPSFMPPMKTPTIPSIPFPPVLTRTLLKIGSRSSYLFWVVIGYCVASRKWVT
jgi:hypothetical protein